MGGSGWAAGQIALEVVIVEYIYENEDTSIAGIIKLHLRQAHPGAKG